MSTPLSDTEQNALVNMTLPAEPTPLVYVIGAGAVGTALAARMIRAGIPLGGVHGREAPLSDAAAAASGALGTTGQLPDLFDSADVVIISVRDKRIPEVVAQLRDSKRLRSNQVLLHTSGAWPAGELLAGARGLVRGIGTLHPLTSFTSAVGAPPADLRGATFAVEGDAEAVVAAERLAKRMGGIPVTVAPDKLALYHAAAVLASNYVVALVELARGLLVQAGVAPERALPALLPLLRSVLGNLDSAGLPDALTGPITRGDVMTVQAHLDALASAAPGLTDLYRRLGDETLRLARTRQDGGGPDEEAGRNLEGLLKGVTAKSTTANGAGKAR